MDNPLSRLALDHWYQVLMLVGAAVFLLSGAGLLPAFPVGPTASMAAGAFFVGMGEWINHPLQTKILIANAYRPGGVVSGHPRSNSFIGVLFLVLGLVLLGAGGYRALI